MPKRRMTVELVEPEDFPRTGTRSEINRYLERFYNQDAARNSYVPYGFWEKGGTRELPDRRRKGRRPMRRACPRDAGPRARASPRGVGPKRRRRRAAPLEGSGLRQPGGRRTRDVLQKEFGFSVDTPESLITVADVVLAAAGQGVSAKASDLKAPPAAWFSESGNRTALSLPQGDTLTAVFLRQAAARPGQPLFADQASGTRTYRDLVTAVLVLKPKLEQMPGPYLGIMMPASVGASVFLLAALFAGKTPVMVNWTTGTRALLHSLDTWASRPS